MSTWDPSGPPHLGASMQLRGHKDHLRLERSESAGALPQPPTGSRTQLSPTTQLTASPPACQNSQQEKPRSYERPVLAAAAAVTAALNKPKGSSTDFFKVNQKGVVFKGRSDH